MLMNSDYLSAMLNVKGVVSAFYRICPWVVELVQGVMPDDV